MAEECENMRLLKVGGGDEIGNSDAVLTILAGEASCLISQR
jgi:hypothetical protein